MTSDVTFELSERNDKDIEEAVIAGLDAYNDQKSEPSNFSPFQVVMRDDAGTRLMALAEDHARAKGCLGMKLNTFSYQAQGFYEKMGFTCWGTMEGYPPGHATHYMRKDL